MADDINISYSYQNGGTAPTGTPAPAPASTQQPLYAFVDCERVNLQNGGVLLIHRHSDKQMVVAAEVSVALHSCSSFRTLDEHVEVLTTTVPQLAGQQADVTQVLAMIRDAGLMTSAADVCQRLQQAAPAATLAPTRVFIITCDRPAAVQRLLQSMLMAGQLSRHEQLFLIDDSREPGNVDLNRELVHKFNTESPRDMLYVGREQQHELMESLIAALPEQEEGIRFLIDSQRWAEQKSYGLARTFSLLLSVDRRAVVMDDDVICAAVASPVNKSGLAFGDTGREVEFYQSEQDILSRTAKTDFDPLSAHASCLGMTMSQAMQTLNAGDLNEQNLHNVNAAYLSQWQGDSPVLVTQTGTMGDPGTLGTEWVYSVDKESAQRLINSPGGLDGALRNRHYWLGQPRPVFSKMAVISQVTGLDNTQLLPPYFPVFRGEDYLFGAMVEYLHPQSAVLEYDWCVPHFPMETRQGQGQAEPPSGKGKINLSKYITDHTVYEAGMPPTTRVKGLAQLIQELTQRSDASLMTLFRIEVAEAQAGQMVRLTAKLQDGVNRPEVWQSYLQQSLNNIAGTMNTAARLEDIATVPEGYTAAEILQQFRSYAHQFASALEGWNNIRSHAALVTNKMIESGAMTP
jgi:hypothetical protein